MQEVSGYLSGETNYMKLRGDTGPLVYPAGFVYVYSALYYLTDLGMDILTGQWMFMGLYLVTLGVVFSIYSKDKSVSAVGVCHCSEELDQWDTNQACSICRCLHMY